MNTILRRSWRSVAALAMLVVACSSANEPPQAVVQEYIQLVNQGHIEEAKLLCTPARQAYLSALSGVMEAAETNPDSSAIEILDVQCQVADTVAVCETLERDSFSEYRAQYTLVRREGLWLVHQPKVSGAIENSEEILIPDEEQE